MTTRQAFEKWVLTQAQRSYLFPADPLEKSGGDYIHEPTEIAWRAWQSGADWRGTEARVA